MKTKPARPVALDYLDHGHPRLGLIALAITDLPWRSIFAGGATMASAHWWPSIAAIVTAATH